MTQSQSKALTPMDEVRGSITRMETEFKNALPAHIDPKKFIRVMLTAIQTSPKLLECNRQSLYAAAMRAAQEGLLPDAREGAIVPYGGEAKWLPMVAGICKKARNSGEISTIDAEVVYEKDKFRAWADEKGRHFEFEKARGDRGNPVTTFAFAITKDGGFFFEEIGEQEMAKIEACSKGSNTPWKGPFRDEMKKKSAIRRLAKYKLPASTDLDQVITENDDMFDLDGPDQQPAPAPNKSSRLSQAVAASSPVKDVTSSAGAPVEVMSEREAIQAEDSPL